MLKCSNDNSKFVSHGSLLGGTSRIFFVCIQKLWQTLNSEPRSYSIQCLCKMIQIDFNPIMLKLRKYFKQNWGSPFVVGFMLLLIVAAFSLSAGSSSLANTVAVYAYYALVAGVFLQLASFLKYRGKTR